MALCVGMRGKAMNGQGEWDSPPRGSGFTASSRLWLHRCQAHSSGGFHDASSPAMNARPLPIPLAITQHGSGNYSCIYWHFPYPGYGCVRALLSSSPECHVMMLHVGFEFHSHLVIPGVSVSTAEEVWELLRRRVHYGAGVAVSGM